MHPKVRQDDVLGQELGTELLLYDARREQAHSLNAVTALIWRHCDGQTSLADLVKVVDQETELPASEEIVWLALDQLEQAGLLEEPLQRPISVQTVSRRQLGRKFGLTAALTLLLPLITSMRVSANPLPGGASPGNPNSGNGCGENITVLGTGTVPLPQSCAVLADGNVAKAVQGLGCNRAEEDALRQATLLCPSVCPPTLISSDCNPGECINLPEVPGRPSSDFYSVTGTFKFECS